MADAANPIAVPLPAVAGIAAPALHPRAKRQPVLRRILGAALLVVGLAWIAAAAWMRWGPSGGIAIVPAVTDLGLIEFRQEVPVRFTVVNRGWRTVQVIGCEMLCGPDGCLAGDGFPFELPPGASHEVEFQYKAPRRPTFDYDGRIYTDAPGQPEVLFDIVGRTPAPPRESKGSADK